MWTASAAARGHTLWALAGGLDEEAPVDEPGYGSVVRGRIGGMEPPRRRGTPRPPQIPGLPRPRAVDVFRLTWWCEVGWIYGAAHGPSRLDNVVLALLGLLLFPVVLATRVISDRLPGARYYMTPARDAVLAVRAARDGWHIEDHMSAHPGRGLGQPLRAALLPRLAAAADAFDVTIHVQAATPGLAGTYQRELPGLRDVGPGRPRGRVLVREPHPREH